MINSTNLPQMLTGGNDGNGNGNLGMGVTVANKPKLIVSNYRLSPEMPQAGQEFELSLTFTNTNAEKSVRNIKISLGSGESGAIPTASQMGKDTAAMMPSGSASVFTPVGSSNTFYIAKIRPQDTARKTIHLKTAPTLAAQNYSINVAFEYEDLLGNEFTATETIGIPVVQTADILLGDVQIKGSSGEEDLSVGTPVNVDLDLYNTGKDPLTNFMVTIQGDGFKVSGSPRYYVGNFNPGASDHFSGEIVPEDNQMNGTILITYEDSTGQKHEKKQTFQKTATGKVGEGKVDRSKLQNDTKTGLLVNPETSQYYDPKTLQPMDVEQPSHFPWLPVGIFAIAVVVAILLIRRHNKKKRQEKELDLDA